MVTIAKFAWCYIEKPKASKPADHVERQLENACLHHMYIQETVFTCLHVEAGPTRSAKKIVLQRSLIKDEKKALEQAKAKALQKGPMGGTGIKKSGKK